MKRRSFLVRVIGTAVALPIGAKLMACGDSGGDDDAADAAAASSFMGMTTPVDTATRF